MLTLSKAARVAGVSKATIHRAIKSGRISAARQGDGSYLIDPAEVSRVYPLILGANDDETSETGFDKTGRKRRETASALAVMAAELAGARQLIDTLRHQVDDLRCDRDAWRQQAETAQRLLGQARDAAPSPPAPARSFWGKRHDERERADRPE
jgi:excisionase family DNA binding protein